MARFFPYTSLRQERGLGRLSALFLACCTLLVWCLLRLEQPGWQRILNNRQYWFPQTLADQPRQADPLRYLVQTVYLLLMREQPKHWMHSARQRLGRLSASLTSRWQARNRRRMAASVLEQPVRKGFRWLQKRSRLQQLLMDAGFVLLAVALMLFSITQPLDYPSQILFMLLLWVIALSVRHLPGRFYTLVMILMSVVVASRYLWWRYTATLNWNSSLDLTFGILLLAAETYAWITLMLGYVQTGWRLDRKPVQLPADQAQWPTVDVFIPTYNEPLAVVRNTLYAAMGLDWPADKLRIHVLDDGRREEFRAFAASVGVGYITRDDNAHAKAGNLNHALKQTDGELVAIFDCDHIPVHTFLQLTAGWFLQDEKMALVQTPHHFFSPDPFERNLGLFRKNPNEGELFYGLVQTGNDTWNAAFFCGSCALLRRSALECIGGFAVETVTEDAHTALRLHRAGWNSAYLGIPEAAGLATESLSAHVAQRIRWARGMVQIFRTDNPLLGKGLSLFQRLCYLNAMMHFLAGLPRLIFLLAPLAFLLCHSYIIYAPAMTIVLHVLPYMVHATLTGSRLQGRHRRSFWGEVYETVLAWYIARPTTLALLNPAKGKFNVTSKGGLMESGQFDWQIARPYLLLALFNFAGLLMAGWRLLYGPAEETGTVIITGLWVLYNLLIIGAAVAVAAEARQVRHSHRVEFNLPAILRTTTGLRFPATLHDYSDGGAGLTLEQNPGLQAGQQLHLVLARGRQEYSFPAVIVRADETGLGLNFPELSQQQKIDLVQCTYARADAWLHWCQDEDKREYPMQSMLEVIRTGLRGYVRLYQFLPGWVRDMLRPVFALLGWLGSFLPRWPGSAAASRHQETFRKTGVRS